jgi:hypothetical protein
VPGVRRDRPAVDGDVEAAQHPHVDAHRRSLVRRPGEA